METHKIHIDFPLCPREIRHIKLGAGNCWAEHAIARNEIVFGDAHIPHDLAEACDWDAVWKLYRENDASDGVATSHTRELKDFYTLGSDCLWITFLGNRLYWGFADPEVRFAAQAEPPRARTIIGGWRSTDASNAPLDTFSMSSAITCTRGAQATITRPSGAQHCLNRINAIANPDVERAKQQELELAQTTLRLIRSLDQNDLEILAARIAEADGWRIESSVGGSQAIVDIVAHQPAINIAGYFQVKARATRSVVDAFVRALPHEPSSSRLIFVTLDVVKIDQPCSNLEIWAGSDLALRALRAGLLPWIIRRAA